MEFIAGEWLDDRLQLGNLTSFGDDFIAAGLRTWILRAIGSDPRPVR